MDISLSQQLFSFVSSIILGAILGIVYELFRTVRSLFGGGTVTVFIQDVLFWIISAFITYTFFLIFTNGTVRIFVIIGMLIGFYIYLKTFGRIIAFLFRQIFRPVKFLCSHIFKLIKKLFTLIFSHKNNKIISENT